jgi:hypothetical protein
MNEGMVAQYEAERSRYADAWKTLRRFRVAWGAGMLIGATGALCAVMSGPAGALFAPVIFGGWLTSVVSWARHWSFRCPRCDQQFNRSPGFWGASGFFRYCPHCGLDAGSLPSLEPSSAYRDPAS